MSVAIGATTMRGGAALPWLLLMGLVAATLAWWYIAPQTMPDVLRGALPASPRAAPVLYRWRDAKGGVHVTDTPPADRPYEAVRYDPNVNVVPSVLPPGTPPKHD